MGSFPEMALVDMHISVQKVEWASFTESRFISQILDASPNIC